MSTQLRIGTVLFVCTLLVGCGTSERSSVQEDRTASDESPAEESLSAEEQELATSTDQEQNGLERPMEPGPAPSPSTADVPDESAPSESADPGVAATEETNREAYEICLRNLKQLQGAKAVWAIMNDKGDDDIPTDSEFFGPDAILRERLRCPLGGTYTVGRVEEDPRCSIPGHALPD